MKRRRLFDFTRDELETEFRQGMARVLTGQDMENPRPAFDPKQAADFEAMQAGGRKSEMYDRTLEHHGFVYVPPHRLPRFSGVVPQPEGRWTHDRLGFGFYPSDLPKQFPGGPEQLDEWLKKEKALRKLVRLGAPAKERAKLLRPRGVA